MNSVENFAGKAKTRIWGRDNILSGGFSRGHVFLVEGAPGTGKTTVALQFLLEGARAGEKCLYITLSETERELRDGAASHGWALDDGIEVFELLPRESLLDSEQQQSLLYSSDVTYLADTVILLRYFEALGAVRRAMSIIKKRTGAHESTIREFRIDGRGLTIGGPLDGFQGILRGVPIYIGEGKPLLEEQIQ
jgi:KaiC/GvpD/RAD55 family RecA-like ATPase